MAQEEKVYTNEVIKDNPLPGEGIAVIGESQGGKEEVYGNAVIPDQPLPQKVIANETIGAALNTKSKKILAEFQFSPSGALQVGKYEQGAAGDLRISPNGITARNSDGDTTFAIDGTTGDAVFKGELRAGSVIATDIETETLINGSGEIDFSPGTDLGLRSDDDNASVLKFIRSDNPNHRVEIYLAEGSGPVREFRIDPTGLMSANAELYLGGAVQWNYINIIAPQIDLTGNVDISGTLTKGAGSFDIPHPNPSKPKGTRLRHSFVESPTAGDNIYRYKIKTVNKKAVIKLPDYFKYLNKNPQVWVTPVNVFGIARAGIKSDRVVVEVTKNGIYNVLIIGTRKDTIAKNHWGKFGLEYIKPERR